MQVKNLFFYIFLLTSSSNLTAQSLSDLYPNSKNRQLSPGKTNYYINPKSGDDRNKGTNKTSAWKTFKRINQLLLSPGDHLIVVSAGAFHESLALMAKGNLKWPVKVTFAPGRYDFYPDQVLKRQIHMTNTNDKPNELKSIALLFDSCQYTNVIAEKTDIVLRGKMIETYLNNCINMSLDGLSFDYERPTVSELTVKQVTANYADVEIHKDSKFSIKDSVITYHGEGWDYKPGYYWQVLNVKTNELSRLDMPDREIRFVALGGNSVRIFFKKNPGFIKDFIYQNRDIMRDCAGIFLQRSKNILLQNIRINFMHGMGIVGQYCENIRLNKVVVQPADDSGRTCAAWADIVHFAGCKGKIEISNCYLSGANDDAINIHGIHLQIQQIIKPNEVVVKFMHDQTFGFNPYAIGDSIDFIHPATLLAMGSNIILASKMINPKEVRLLLKDPLPLTVAIGDAIENTTATPEIWIHHNKLARIPTRGILVTSRRKTIIEHNDFQRTHMTAVLVNDDAAYWFESGLVKNLMIRNNKFFQCAEPVVDIHPENIESTNTPVHTNISVINNTFELRGNKLFAAKSTGNIKLTGNKIRVHGPIKKLDQLIELKDCKNVEIQNNVLKN